MLLKKGESDRFSKVLQKLNPPTDKVEPQKLPEQSSFLHDFSVRSEKSTKYGSQIEARSTSTTGQQMDESRAIKLLLEEPEVLINKVVTKIRTEFIPTSNGIRFIMLVGNSLVNLSWIHSIKEIEPGKLLLLYYDLKNLADRKAKMESLVLEVGRKQGVNLLSALQLLHGKYHDD
jgi:hypothetical protein